MLVSICFFLSGAAALVLQVLWVRMLGHVFGATALAVSSTLTAFMGGLALGAFLIGKRAPRLKNPLLVFAILETSIGLYGLMVPHFLEALPGLQTIIAQDNRFGFWVFSLIRFLLVTLILLIPTTAMGATLPVLAEGVVKKSNQMAPRVGELYAANTFGAVLGALLGGFVLIPKLGMTTTVYVAAGIDLGVALIVFFLGRMKDESFLIRRRSKSSIHEILAEFKESVELVISDFDRKLVLWVFAGSGAAAMALQVLWTRAVGVVIGASTYAFTLILSTFLIGLSLGAMWMTRHVQRLSRPVRFLARIQVAVGLFAVFGTVFVDKLPYWLHSVAIQSDLSIGGLYAANFVIAAIIMLPTTIMLGMIMPLVVRILAEKDDSNAATDDEAHLHAGPVVARAYTFNTLGAIVGSFAGGFILLPIMGVQNGLFFAAGVSLVLGAILAFRDRDRLFQMVAALGICLIFVLPKWDVSSWTAGLFRIYLVRSVFSDGWEAGGKLIYHRDGIASTVTVEQADDENGVWLKVNGKVDASDYGDMPTQVLSGLLPVLAMDDPKDVLVIGYGSGVTPGAVLQAPVKSVTLVELEEAVLEAADRYFAHVNHRPPTHERYQAIVDDGRNYLLSHDRTFDIIISEPSNPWMSGASSLFTQDFFEIAKSRLNEEGVFLQWLQLYELSPANIHAILRTFQSVFPEVVVFSPSSRSNDTLLLGSRRPIRFKKSRLEQALADKRFGKELARADIEWPEDFFGLFVAQGKKLRAFVGPGPLNTDDNAMIEFAAPRDLLEYSQKDAHLPFVDEVSGNRLGELHQVFSEFDFEESTQLARGGDRLMRQGRRADAQAFLARARQSLNANTSTKTLALLQNIENVLGHFSGSLDEVVVVDTPNTRGELRYAKVVRALVNGNEEKALELADFPDGFEEISPGHRFVYAYLCYIQERFLDAEFLIKRTLKDEDFVRAYPGVFYYAAHIFAERGKPSKAVEYMERFVASKKRDEASSIE